VKSIIKYAIIIVTIQSYDITMWRHAWVGNLRAFLRLRWKNIERGFEVKMRSSKATAMAVLPPVDPHNPTGDPSRKIYQSE
jgi:hypothetical protein